MNSEQLTNNNSNQTFTNTNNQKSSQNDTSCSDEFQQILNENVAIHSITGETPGADDKIQFQPKDNDDKTNFEKPSFQQPQERKYLKINVLYFIGVNSILMNLFAIRIISCFCAKFIIFLLGNAITFICLYKFKQVERKMIKIQNRLKQFRSKITKKKLFITFGVLLLLALTFSTLFLVITLKSQNRRLNYIEIHNQQLKYQINYLNQLKNSPYNYHQQISDIINKQKQFEDNYQKSNRELYSKVIYLQKLASTQQESIEMLTQQLRKEKQNQHKPHYHHRHERQSEQYQQTRQQDQQREQRIPLKQ